jgi:hypothetical protein
MKAVPTDPLNTGVFVYTYTAGTGNSSYTLKACLENGSDTGQYTNNDSACTGTTRNFQLVNNN